MLSISIYKQTHAYDGALKAFKCPDCNYAYQFYYTTPITCKGCNRMMVDIMTLVNLPSRRVRWHFGEPK